MLLLLIPVRHPKDTLVFLPGVELFSEADPETPLVSRYNAFETPFLNFHSSVHPLDFNRNQSQTFEDIDIYFIFVSFASRCSASLMEIS